MKKQLLIMVIALGLTTTANAADYSVKMAESFRNMNDRQIDRAFDSFRKTLPRSLDSVTTIEAVTSANRVATYQIKIDLTDTGVTPKQMAVYFNNDHLVTANRLCTQKLSRAMLEGDLMVRYSYFDTKGRFITNIVIDKEDCQ